MGIIGRLLNIARANVLQHTGMLENLIDRALNPGKPSSKPGRDYTRYYGYTGGAGGGTGRSSDGSGGGSSGPARDAGRQAAEDLAVFNLQPPSSMEEVRRARNREIKKYHSDKFMNDPEKQETSKQIMQIYNAAYDRLKKHYDKSG